MSPQFSEAFKRAGWAALLAGALVGLETYRDDQDLERAIVLAMIAVVSAMIARGAVEGAIDTERAKNHDVIASDVRPG